MGGAIYSYNGGVHNNIVIVSGAFMDTSTTFTFAKCATHEAKDIVPKIRRCQDLHGGKYVVQTGEQHKYDPVGLAQHLFVFHDDVVTHPKQKKLNGPRNKVPKCRDGILSPMSILHINPDSVNILFDQLRDYDGKQK